MAKPNNRIHLVLAWIPLVLWVGANVYVSQWEGWGAWAAAPILIFPLVVSLIVGAYYLILILMRPSDPRPLARRIAVIILAWLPILHAIASNLWRRMT